MRAVPRRLCNHYGSRSIRGVRCQGWRSSMIHQEKSFGRRKSPTAVDRSIKISKNGRGYVEDGGSATHGTGQHDISIAVAPKAGSLHHWRAGCRMLRPGHNGSSSGLPLDPSPTKPCVSIRAARFLETAFYAGDEEEGHKPLQLDIGCWVRREMVNSRPFMNKEKLLPQGSD